jgi:hypothetical protein
MDAPTRKTPAPARWTRRARLRAAAVPLALPLAAAALGGCARPGEQRAAAPAGSLAGVTVRYWNRAGASSPEEVARTKVLEAFNAQNPSGARVGVATARTGRDSGGDRARARASGIGSGGRGPPRRRRPARAALHRRACDHHGP